jgi:hypothetical protein
MTQIVLTPEQYAMLDAANEPVAICKPDGTVAAVIAPQSRFVAPPTCPFTPEEVAAALKEADGPGPFYTTQEVRDYLHSLNANQP